MASAGDPRGWPDRLLGLAVTLLLAAFALFYAVQLIERVWLPLAVSGCVLLGLATTIGWLRSRHGGW